MSKEEGFVIAPSTSARLMIVVSKIIVRLDSKEHELKGYSWQVEPYRKLCEWGEIDGICKFEDINIIYDSDLQGIANLHERTDILILPHSLDPYVLRFAQDVLKEFLNNGGIIISLGALKGEPGETQQWLVELGTGLAIHWCRIQRVRIPEDARAPAFMSLWTGINMGATECADLSRWDSSSHGYFVGKMPSNARVLAEGLYEREERWYPIFVIKPWRTGKDLLSVLGAVSYTHLTLPTTERV